MWAETLAICSTIFMHGALLAGNESDKLLGLVCAVLCFAGMVLVITVS